MRGLSEVSTTRSAARAAASPMSGRLPRSRSPPQPKTAISAPGVSGRSAVEQRVERVGRVRVVDDHREAGARRCARRARAAARVAAMPAGDRGRVDAERPRRARRRSAMFSACGAPTSGLVNGTRSPPSTSTPRVPASVLSTSSRRTSAPAARPERARSASAHLAARRAPPASSTFTTATGSGLPRRRQELGEEPRLGGVVRLQVAVEVEVVAREVGEHGGVEAQPAARSCASACDETSIATCVVPAARISASSACSVGRLRAW